MTAAFPALASAPRWVRVAVVRGGAIVAEKRVDPGATLSFGSAEGADLALPGAPFARHELLRPGASGPELVVPSGAKGRIANGGRIHEVEALAGALVPLDASARGRIEIGDVAFLIERCAAPAKRNKPALPAVVRGDLLRDADWAFTAFVAASLMVHAAVVTGISEMDFAVASAATIPDHYAQSIFIEPPMPDVPDDAFEHPDVSDETEVTRDDTTTEPAPETPVRTPRSHEGPRVAHRDDGGESIDPEAIARDATGQLLGLGTIAGEGTPLGVLIEGGDTSGQADLLATLTGAELAHGEPGALHTRAGSRTGEIVGDIGSLTRTTPGSRGEGHDLDERRISVPPPPEDDFTPIGPSPDPGETDLVAQIRRRMGAVRACYERELRDHPDLEGRLVLQVRAELSGSLSGVRVTEDTMHIERLETCVTTAIRSVRLRQPPQDEAVVASFPLVFSHNL